MATQVLPTPSTQFHAPQMSYPNDMLSSFPHFDQLPAGNAPYHSEPPQSLLMVSPPTSNSEIQFRRRSSHSPQAALGATTMRDRTPIRHHRPSLSRGRSHSRSEMLLAYAAEQNQLHQSQSLPSMPAMQSQNSSSMPQMYSMPAYNMSPPITNFAPQGGYFGAQVPPPTGPSETSEFPMHHNETETQTFYPVGRTSSHGSVMSLPPPDSPNALYVHGQPQHNQQPLPSIGMTMQPFPTGPLTLESSPAEIEIMPSRPKPQCWDHGCNGRQFSTFSNLLRHQREKSGSAMKAVCPHCGTEFTRTTARNGHMSGGKCKGRPEGEGPNRAKKES